MLLTSIFHHAPLECFPAPGLDAGPCGTNKCGLRSPDTVKANYNITCLTATIVVHGGTKIFIHPKNFICLLFPIRAGCVSSHSARPYGKHIFLGGRMVHFAGLVPSPRFSMNSAAWVIFLHPWRYLFPKMWIFFCYLLLPSEWITLFE